MTFALKWWPHLGLFGYIGYWQAGSARIDNEHKYVLKLVRHYNAVICRGQYGRKKDIIADMLEN